MTMKFLQLNIDPSQVKVIQFNCDDVEPNADDKARITQVKNASSNIDNLRKSMLNMRFILKDDTEIVAHSVSGCLYFEPNGAEEEHLCQKINLHDEAISAFTFEFNRCAIKAGYPVSFRPTVSEGWFVYDDENEGDPAVWLDGAKKDLTVSLAQINQIDSADSLFMCIDIAFDACANAHVFLMNGDKVNDPAAAAAFYLTCQYAVNFVRGEFKRFTSTIDAKAIEVHESAHELAVAFIQRWILEDLHYPHQSTSEFLNNI